MPGIPGPPGPQGPRGAQGYNHTQGSAAFVWVINHGLGYLPRISAALASGVEVEGDVDHLSEFTATITFNQAIAGTAHAV